MSHVCSPKSHTSQHPIMSTYYTSNSVNHHWHPPNECSWRWQLIKLFPSCSGAIMQCIVMQCMPGVQLQHEPCSCTRAGEICTDPWRALNFAKLTFDHPCYIVCYSGLGCKKWWMQLTENVFSVNINMKNPRTIFIKWTYIALIAMTPDLDRNFPD